MKGLSLSRRDFFKLTAMSTTALTATGAFGSWTSEALAAIDPHSHGNRVFHATHYGPIEGIVRNGRLIAMAPMPELDARPSILLKGILDRTYDKTRLP